MYSLGLKTLLFEKKLEDQVLWCMPLILHLGVRDRHSIQSEF